MHSYTVKIQQEKNSGGMRQRHEGRSLKLEDKPSDPIENKKLVRRDSAFIPYTSGQLTREKHETKFTSDNSPDEAKQQEGDSLNNLSNQFLFDTCPWQSTLPLVQYVQHLQQSSPVRNNIASHHKRSLDIRDTTIPERKYSGSIEQKSPQRKSSCLIPSTVDSLSRRAFLQPDKIIFINEQRYSADDIPKLKKDLEKASHGPLSKKANRDRLSNHQDLYETITFKCKSKLICSYCTILVLDPETNMFGITQQNEVHDKQCGFSEEEYNYHCKTIFIDESVPILTQLILDHYQKNRDINKAKPPKVHSFLTQQLLLDLCEIKRLKGQNFTLSDGLTETNSIRSIKKYFDNAVASAKKTASVYIDSNYS